MPGIFHKSSQVKNDWPVYFAHRAPEFVRLVLDSVPEFNVSEDGLLNLVNDDSLSAVPLATTQWNRERSRPQDRLEGGHRWAIVLHWFGDVGETDQTLDAYLRGFDALRPVFNYETRTSAHFIVGSSHPGTVSNPVQEIGVVQTQSPDADGTPFLASHLQGLDYTSHWDKKQYFVRAFYQLAHKETHAVSVLQEWFDSPNVVDPNLRSIAVEVTGHDFDSAPNSPGIQKIANVTALVWSLMKRYRIHITDVLGHHEIQLGKSDPGKKFITLIRFLVGVLALQRANPEDMDLVFGNFTSPGELPADAVRRYFNFVRNYLVLVGTPLQVYEWESFSQFWLAYEAFLGSRDIYLGIPGQFTNPIDSGIVYRESGYLIPDNHEGVDFNTSESRISARLISRGQCLYAGDTGDPHWGKTALFRHRQHDGAEIVAIYAHLDSIAEVKTGMIYPQRFPVGQIQRPNSYQDAYLHFAIAYGATWDTDLSKTPFPPPNAGSAWIMPRYLEPLQYLQEKTKPLALSKRGYKYD